MLDSVTLTLVLSDLFVRRAAFALQQGLDAVMHHDVSSENQHPVGTHPRTYRSWRLPIEHHANDHQCQVQRSAFPDERSDIRC